MTRAMFYNAEVNCFYSPSRFLPSSWMKFLAVLQPFHLHIWIGNLDGQLYFMSLCHLVSGVQLFEEGCVLKGFTVSAQPPVKQDGSAHGEV